MGYATDFPAVPVLPPARGGVLAPALCRDVADLNAQYLELGLAAGAESDPRFSWAAPVRTGLDGADSDTLARLAATPFALFELVLPPGRARVRIEDGGQAARPDSLFGRAQSFAHQAAFLARRLVESGSLVAGIVFDLAPEQRRWLLECRPSQLAGAALDPGTIRPRWRSHVRFWQMLIGAARHSSASALEWAHCSGLCLLGADGAPQEPVARRRTGR